MPGHRIQYPELSPRQLIEPEKDETELIPESPCIDTELRSDLETARWVHNMQERLVRQNHQTCFLSRNCAAGLFQPKTVGCVSSMSRVLSVFKGVRVVHECVNASVGCKSL